MLKDVAPEGATRTRERNDEEEIRKTPGGSGSGSDGSNTPAVIKRDGKMANNNDAAGSAGYLPAEISRAKRNIGNLTGGRTRQIEGDNRRIAGIRAAIA